MFSPWTAITVLLMILIWLGLANNNLRKDLQAVKEGLDRATLANNGHGEDMADFKITSPEESSGMVYENVFRIEGEADDNSVVMLMSGGKLLEVAKPQGGVFSFDDVKITRKHTAFSVQMMSPEGERQALETMEFRYNTPTAKHLSRSFDRGNIEAKFVALTFDGGSLNNATDEVLNTLKSHGLKSTFFLTGRFVERFPETFLRILAEGHEVGNHTMNHPHLTTFENDGKHETREEMTKEVFQAELQETTAAFESLSSERFVPFWRAPFGEHNADLRRWAAELGYRQVGWTVGEGDGETMDTKDWVADPSDPNYYSADEIYRNILEFADSSKYGAKGAIILMHLGSDRVEDFPHRSLPDVIAGLNKRGYQFVTVSELTGL